MFRSNVPPEIVTFAVLAIMSVLVPVYFTVPPLMVRPPPAIAFAVPVFAKYSSPALTVVNPV